jgi:hypothetical protein
MWSLDLTQRHYNARAARTTPRPAYQPNVRLDIQDTIDEILKRARQRPR